MARYFMYTSMVSERLCRGLSCAKTLVILDGKKLSRGESFAIFLNLGQILTHEKYFCKNSRIFIAREMNFKGQLDEN